MRSLGLYLTVLAVLMVGIAARASLPALAGVTPVHAAWSPDELHARPAAPSRAEGLSIGGLELPIALDAGWGTAFRLLGAALLVLVVAMIAHSIGVPMIRS